MEDTSNTSSTTKEATAQGTPCYYPAAWSFNEAIRAILRCLGLEETEFRQNPSTPKKEGDNKAINDTTIQADSYRESPAVASTDEGADPPSTTDSSDPVIETDPSTDPSSTTGDPSVDVSLSTPARPGTGTGSGGQIN